MRAPHRVNGCHSEEGGRHALGDAAESCSCGDPDSRVLLVPYALARCPDEAAEVFEAHLLGCGACFEDLKSLDRAGRVIHEYLGSGSSAADRLRDSLLRARESAHEGADVRSSRRA